MRERERGESKKIKVLTFKQKSKRATMSTEKKCEWVIWQLQANAVAFVASAVVVADSTRKKYMILS